MTYYFLTRQMGGASKSMDFGRSRARLTSDKDKTKFDKVAGLTEEKEEVQELIDFLREPKKFQKMGARIPKGVLLVGPPGTGKTLLAKAVAGEANVPFYFISGSDFVELFVGVGASRVREHDVGDIRGYIIEEEGSSMVYITDTGYIREKDFDALKNKTLYVFESNHDVERLMDNPNYPHHVKIRILSDKGHLSNMDSSKYMAKFIGKDTKYVILAHLSEQNNTEALALSTLKETLKEKEISFSNISIARQNEKTEIFNI